MNIAIYSRAKTNGKWKFIRVEIKPGPKPKIDGPFYLRYTQADGKQPFVPAGDTLDEARKTAARIQPQIEAEAVETKANSVKGSSALCSKAAAYNLETEANKAPKTALMYRNTLRYFTASCNKRFVENITREDMLKFKTDLKNENLSERSVYNNFLNVTVFLKWAGVSPKDDLGVKKGDWPDKPERAPEEYTEEEIVMLLNAADSDERLILNSFLCSGLRSGELCHLTYGDIDYKHSVWTVRPKDGWKTKTQAAQRNVPVALFVTKRIRERMDAGKKPTDLIFPNIHGKPNLHMERIVKRVAKRAGVSGRVDDHKFRSTAITRWLRDGVSPQDVMKWVGHKSLETILRYAANLNVRKAAAVSGQAFEQFANVGGD